jgi:FAD/FMN-containing dehydrogenase
LAANKSVLYNKLKNIVGSENITDNEIIAEAYTETGTHAGRTIVAMKSRKEEAAKKPSFVTRPGSTEEVQEIVRLANQYKVPIVPMGAFTGVYRDAVPLEGGIMLDFDRMKKIEIDEDMMTVTFEPGVTWADAYQKMTPLGYMPSYQALPAGVSILGCTTQAGTHLPLDKHAIPYSTFYSCLTMGMEVVLPTGELLVTGSAALPGAKPQHAHAYGPDVGAIILGAQGTLGIVVKQTLPLWMIPEARHTVTGLFKDENFEGLSKATHRIIIDNFVGPIWTEKVWAVYKGEVLRKPWKRLGEWELYVQLYGRKKRVGNDRKIAEEIITEEGGKIAAPRESEWPEIEPTYSPGPPYEEAIFWRPRANSIVLPNPLSLDQFRLNAAGTYRQMPELHDAMLRVLAKHGIPKSKINQGGLSISARYQGRLTQSLSFTYYYEINNAEEVKRVNAINEEWKGVEFNLTGQQKALSSVYYRPTPTHAKELMPMLGEYYKLLVKLKRTLDPNRIMNPGHLMDFAPY